MCDMTHSYTGHDSFTCVTRLIHICDDSLICVTRLIHMWDGTRLIRMWDMSHSHVWQTHSRVWRNSFMCVTRPIQMCDMSPSFVQQTHSHVWRDLHSRNQPLITGRIAENKSHTKKDAYFAKETDIFKEPTNCCHPHGDVRRRSYNYDCQRVLVPITDLPSSASFSGTKPTSYIPMVAIC